MHDVCDAALRRSYAQYDDERSAAAGTSEPDDGGSGEAFTEDAFGLLVPIAVPVPAEPTEEELMQRAKRFFSTCWGNWKTLASDAVSDLNAAVKAAVSSAASDDTDRELEFSQGLTALWATIKFTPTDLYCKAEASYEVYGFLPMLARRYLGRLLAESFCERILSVANRVVTTNNTDLDSAEVGLIVMLRSNTALIDELFSPRDVLKGVLDPEAIDADGAPPQPRTAPAGKRPAESQPE